jgi:hypothetical protein
MSYIPAPNVAGYFYGYFKEVSATRSPVATKKEILKCSHNAHPLARKPLRRVDLDLDP